MPIYIVERDDHRQISADDLAQLMKIDKSILDKIKKNPVFVINPKLTKPDKLNGGVIAPAGKRSKPKIYVKVSPPSEKARYGIITDDLSGKQVEIRYAIAIVPDPINPRISTYEPKRMIFDDQMDIVPNLEEALFKYCLPSCKDSPIADQRNWYYSFQNKQAAATEITDKGKMISKALAMISNTPENGGLTDHQLMLVAKGLYAQNRNPAIIPNPSARNKTIDEVKADLVTLALKDPQLFVNTCDDDVNEFYGMILDAVDRGIFGVRRGANSTGWYWEQGSQSGTHITDVTGGVNEFDALKGAIEANPNAFYSTITRAVQAAAGKESISDFLKAKKESAGNETEEKQKTEVKSGGSDTFVLPTSFEESNSMAIMFNDGKRPDNKILGAFWRAVKEKLVTAENAKTILADIIAKQE